MGRPETRQLLRGREPTARRPLVRIVVVARDLWATAEGLVVDRSVRQGVRPLEDRAREPDRSEDSLADDALIRRAAHRLEDGAEEDVPIRRVVVAGAGFEEERIRS